MMPIKEAIATLKKMRDCETTFCSDTIYCSECPHWVGHIEKIPALETAVNYVKRKNGEN